MELRKVAIHEIQKERGVNETNLILSDEQIQITENVEALISALLSSYKGDKILYAVFNNSEGNYFPERYISYKNSERNDRDFIDFTKNALANLNPIIRAKTLASGGYFIFAEYSVNNINFFSIFLVRDTEGKILRRTEHSYEIDTIEYLDTRNLAMACRINESKLDNGEDNYLSFTQVKQKEIADYFLDWISVEQLESSTEYTKSLYEIVNQIPPPIDPETNQEYPIEEHRNNVYNYITSNPNKVVNLRDLGEHFYNNPDIYIDYAEKHDISIDTEFRYNKRQLRRFIKVEINRDGINLKVSRGALNDKVTISEDDPNVVLIRSEKFANALRQELND